jgi:carbon-monoxide dehydrogenase iron sulfur subunit
MSRDGRAVVKCDLCIERTQAGEEPACVSACPTGALAFVEIDEYNRRKRQAAAEMLQAAQKAGAR